MASKCAYKLQTLPAWSHLPDDWTPHESKPLPVPKGTLAWSGKDAPPAIGDRVTVYMNGFGTGRVLSYFREHGFLGIEVEIDRLPDWFLKQNGNRPALFFGVDLNPE